MFKFIKMSYSYSKTVSGTDFNSLRNKIEAELQKEGFGIVSEVDIQATMKKKLNKDYLPHLILGACNPVYADKILSIEPTISTLLPCNVTLREISASEIEVSMINPTSLLSIVGLPKMVEMASDVETQIKSMIDRL